jgi:hypothetical protein
MANYGGRTVPKFRDVLDAVGKAVDESLAGSQDANDGGHRDLLPVRRRRAGATETSRQQAPCPARLPP